MLESEIGRRIGQLRKDLNLTRTEFGERIGMSARSVGKIERGALTISSTTIANICKETGVSADYIIFGNHDPMAVAAELNELTFEQANLVLDIAMNVIKFLSTETGNNALIKEVLRRVT